MKKNSIKQIVWGFQNIIYSLYPKNKIQKEIIKKIAVLFNSTVENLLPYKYFIRCKNKGSDIIIFIFDTEEDCENWINENRHLFISCDKITFDEFDKFSKGTWHNWTNYIDEIECTYCIVEYDKLMKSEYDDPLEFIQNYWADYNMFDNDIENINIKQIIWGFCKIIDNLDSEFDEQLLSIRTDIISTYNSTIKKLMPTKFFVYCYDMDCESPLTNKIFIFDCEEECEDWIEQWEHFYSGCEKITFDDLNRMFGDVWENPYNYFSQQSSMELGQDWEEPLRLELDFC